MALEITIREANLADVELLTELVAEVQDPHVEHRPETFKPLAREEVAAWFRALFENTSVKIWIAEAEGAAQGYVGTVVRQQAENPFAFARTSLELDQIGVRRDYRRKGIARALVKSALAYATASGIGAVELTSWSFNRGAHEAFRKLGFEPKVIRFEWKT